MTDQNDCLVAGPMGAGFCGYLVSGAGVAKGAMGPDLAAVQMHLGAVDVPVLPVSQDAFDQVPAAVEPAGITAIAGLTQATPQDQLDGWVRLAAWGFLTRHADWDGVLVILYAGRSHWLHVSANEVVSFQTTLTPQWVTMLGGARQCDLTAIAEILSRPERLTTLLSRAEYAGAGARITATLIGAELAAMRAYWLGQNLAVIAPDDAPDYAAALQAQGGAVVTCGLSDALQAAMGALWARRI